MTGGSTIRSRQEVAEESMPEDRLDWRACSRSSSKAAAVTPACARSTTDVEGPEVGVRQDASNVDFGGLFDGV